MGNFYSCRKASLLAMSFLGISLVYLANGHDGPFLSLLPHEIAHDLHCGTKLHRVVNLTGCALLLKSNSSAQKAGFTFHVHGPTCRHSNYWRKMQKKKKIQ